MLRLDIPDSLIVPRQGSSDLAGALPVVRRDRPAFIANADGQQVGFVRFSPRRPDGRWVMTAIAASAGVYSPEPVWEALVAHGVRVAGLRGVRRLYARAPVGHQLAEWLRQAGWAAYARETVFRAERPYPLAGAIRNVHRQDPADTWAIHQLYADTVPRHIQEVEAFTSHVWHMDQPRRGRRSVRQSGWLLEDGGQFVAYARFMRGPRAGMVDALVAPGEAARFGALLDHVIVESRRGRPRPVYCALRGYLLDSSSELLERGFIEIDPVHFPVELRPAIPRRVPTFLERQPTDGTV
jgi:hypothetical protein